MRLSTILLCIFTLMVLNGCGTTDGDLIEQGKGESYLLGFHDGRHSGMKKESNNYEHYIRDEARFIDDVQYSSGWLDGEIEGKALQNKAVSIGNTVAGGLIAADIEKEVKKIPMWT